MRRLPSMEELDTVWPNVRVRHVSPGPHVVEEEHFCAQPTGKLAAAAAGGALRWRTPSSAHGPQANANVHRDRVGEAAPGTVDWPAQARQSGPWADLGLSTLRPLVVTTGMFSA